jgi:hypothetical protein
MSESIVVTVGKKGDGIKYRESSEKDDSFFKVKKSQKQNIRHEKQLFKNFVKISR